MSTSQRTPSSRGRIAALSPLAKVALWLVVVAALAVVIQSIAWVLGLDFNIVLRRGGGQGVLLALAITTLLLMMAADGAPASQYGLFVGPKWRKLLLRGFALGVTTYAAYSLLAWLLIGGTLRTAQLTPSLCTKAALTAMTAFPVAMAQQFLFSGSLVGALSTRCRRLTSVLVPAALFALTYRLGNPAELLQPSTQSLLIGIFLVATLLGLLRLKTGSILFPAGLLAGWIFLRRLLMKTGVLDTSELTVAHAWVAPGVHVCQAPLVWLFLAIAIGVCWVFLHRDGEAQVQSAGVDADFKRFFPLSNVSMLAPLDVWLARLADARFRVGLKYLPRLLAILVLSAINTLISLPERLLLPLFLRGRPVSDPVFILGVHRSGTTHLHNLLALDPQFCTPRAYHMLNPVGFLFSGWLFAPLFGAFLPWKRPMDSVRFHIFTPQEDEYALAAAGRLSPYWGLTFPQRGAEYDRFALPQGFTPRESTQWKNHLLLFLRKLTFWSGKRPLLKNPYHTGRVEMLREMFPGAKFIHIARHPFDVHRSYQHMVREGHIVNYLQDPDESDSAATRFLGNYRAIEDEYVRATASLPKEQVAALRFEDLERDAIGEIRRVYQQLGLTLEPAFARRLKAYLQSISGYKKNAKAALVAAERDRIIGQLGDFMQRHGYTHDGAACDQAVGVKAAPTGRRRDAGHRLLRVSGPRVAGALRVQRKLGGNRRIDRKLR